MYKVAKYPQGISSWADNSSADPEAAKAFYMDRFGWEYDFDGIFTRIFNRGRANGGMLQLEDVKPCWLPHFHVADIDAAMQRVDALGGQVITQKMEASAAGCFAVVEDPAGARFYIMQLTRAEPWQD